MTTQCPGNISEHHSRLKGTVHEQFRPKGLGTLRSKTLCSQCLHMCAEIFDHSQGLEKMVLFTIFWEMQRNTRSHNCQWSLVWYKGKSITAGPSFWGELPLTVWTLAAALTQVKPGVLNLWLSLCDNSFIRKVLLVTRTVLKRYNCLKHYKAEKKEKGNTMLLAAQLEMFSENIM